MNGPPTVGATIELTIDAQLQHVVERELRAGIERHNADAGAVVMLDPRNGDILALASEPTFNPNAFAEATPEQRRNRAVQDLYEPGSTFKVVTASAAIEERVVERDEVFDVSAGYIVVAGDRIPDFRRTGPLTFEDVIVRSSNVGAIQVGLRLGPERLSRYVRRYGFGQALSADFPSESSGLVWTPESLTDRAIASIAMGYQVAVTPLQVAAAVGAVANGGDLIAPRLVRAVVRPDGRDERERRVIRRAISRQTAAELTDIMSQVVERGTARNSRVPGYTIAGKTGTAEKLIRRRVLALRPQRFVRRFCAGRGSSLRDAGHDRHTPLRADQRRGAAGLHRRRGGGADLPAHRFGGIPAARRAGDRRRRRTHRRRQRRLR